MNQRKKGQYYEEVAKNFLIKRGFTHISSNFTTKVGEIDLIMQEGETLVFVEVKYRKTAAYGHAAEMVTTRKMNKLIKAANIWLLKNQHSPFSTDFRFDVIAIHDMSNDINWIRNAITQR